MFNVLGWEMLQVYLVARHELCIGLRYNAMFMGRI